MAEENKKRSETSEEPKEFRAFCDNKSHGQTGWSGKCQPSQELAQHDVHTHTLKFPNHKVDVIVEEC